MNKGIILRASLILGTFLIIILVAVGCEVFDGSATEAQISNPNDVYLTVDGTEITNEEIWSVMKNVDGLDYLFEYIQEDLLKDYITAITDEDVAAEVELLTYLTEDPSVIAEIKDNAEINQDYLDAFRQNVEVLGYDVNDPASIKEFISLSLAKRAYVKELMLTATEDDTLYINPTSVEDYYNGTRFGNVCSLDVRFQNTLEADAVFEHFKLVPNYMNGIGEYIGTEDMSTLAKGDYNETNTIELSETAAWGYYVKLYNYMNPWLTPLAEDITPVEYCTANPDASKSYDDLVKYQTETAPTVLFADYIYNDLDLEDDGVIPFTYTTNKVFGDYIMMVYKVSQDEVTAYEDLTTAEYDVVFEELMDTLLTDEVINASLTTLMEENDFELFDPQFKLQYEFTTGDTYDNNGSKTVLATYNDKEVNVDDFFAYMTDRIGTFYSLEVAKVKVLVNSDAYETTYGTTSHDYLNDKSDKLVEHRDSLREMKSIFSSDGYSSYGFSSSAMSWDEFIYLAFSVEGESDLIESMFVLAELQTGFTFDTIEYLTAVDYMQDKVDRYYSLNVDHILLYVDFDLDFEPDAFDDFVDGLDAAGLVEYNALKVNLENLLAAKFNDGYSLQDVVDEYTESLTGDATSEYYEFKQYGLFIMTENLGDIDHNSGESLDAAFDSALKRIYDSYSASAGDDESYTDDQVVVSDFGIHLIEVTKGTNFEMATAVYEAETTGEYSDGATGTTIIPNAEQVALYLEIQRQVLNGDNPDEILPSNVQAAIEYYFSPVYEAYISQTGFSIAMGNHLLANNLTYTSNNTESLADLEKLIDVLYEVNFPELFDKDAE